MSGIKKVPMQNHQQKKQNLASEREGENVLSIPKAKKNEDTPLATSAAVGNSSVEATLTNNAGRFEFELETDDVDNVVGLAILPHGLLPPPPPPPIFINPDPFPPAILADDDDDIGSSFCRFAFCNTAERGCGCMTLPA